MSNFIRIVAITSLCSISACSQFKTTPVSSNETSESGEESTSEIKAVTSELSVAGHESTLSVAKVIQTALLQPDLKQKVNDSENALAALEDDKQPLLPPKDIWQRIRNGYQFDPNISNKRVDAEIRWYTKHPAYLNRTFTRGEPYLHYIVEEADKRGVPLELTLLPIVESSFDPFAYSHGRAAGIWQFIPGTGKQYGLKQTWWYDGRRDVPAATQAAFNYLEDLAKTFDGDWLLALAAYNSGAGTVLRAIKRNKAKGKPTDFWNLRLPKETRAYVPRLIAISKVVATPEKYNISLKPIANEPRFTVVKLDSQIDLAKAAELAEISVDELYLLNPGFNHWATDPEGPHKLVVPLDKEIIFKERYAALPEDQRIKWKRYVIKQGDSLIKIAKKFKTTTAVLKDVNNFKGSLIRAGKAMLIPSSYQPGEYYAFDSTNRLAKKQARGGKSGSKKLSYTARKGDTLWDIAQEYKVSVRKLASWNGMAPTDVLKPGKKMVIWAKTSKSTSASSTSSSPGIVRKVGYRVRRGDSLYRIASRFNVSVNQLAKWNSLRQSATLYPGQRLNVFVDVTKTN